MSKPVPKGTKPRSTTLIFRLFRQKNAALSRQYWTSEAGRHSIRTALAGAKATDRAVEAMAVTFETRHLDDTVEDLLARLDEHAGTERLHLLVICSANLESFLQDAVALYVAQKGYCTTDRQLDVVGHAMASPVVDRSTVPDMLEYTEQLLGLNFGADLTKWRRAYKLRCSAAHEGGFMSADTAKKLGASRHVIGALINVSWDELKSFMVAAHSIANAIDKKIATGPLREFEVAWTLAQWKRDQTLPSREEVWNVLHELGIKVERPKKQAMEKWVYA